MLTKLNLQGDILELETAFLRFQSKEIEETLELVKDRAASYTFKKNIKASTIPQPIFLFSKGEDMINHEMFSKKWQLKFKSHPYIKLFSIYWEATLKHLNYSSIYLKNEGDSKRFYKIIDVRANSTVHEICTFLSTR